jgi:hypothetical protein
LNSRNLSSNLPPHGGAFLSPNDLPSSPAASTQQWGILHQRSQSSDANPQQQQQQQQRVFVSAEEIIADLLAKPLSLDGPIFNLAYISMGSSAGPGEAPPLPESADQQQQKVRRQSSGASFTLVKNTAADSDDAKCGDPPLPKRPPKAGIAGGNIDAFEPQQQQRPIPVPRSIKPFPLPPAPLKSQQTPRNNTVEAPTSKAPVLIRRSNLFGEAIDGGEAASPSFQTEPSVASSQKQKSPPQQSQQQQRRPNTLNLHGDGATGGPGNGSDKYQPAFSRSPPPQTLDSTASSGGGTSGGPPLMKRCREGKTPIVSPPPPLTATDRESEQPPSSPQMEECAITVFGVSPVSAPTSFTILTTRPASAAEERQGFLRFLLP